MSPGRALLVDEIEALAHKLARTRSYDPEYDGLHEAQERNLARLSDLPTEVETFPT